MLSSFAAVISADVPGMLFPVPYEVTFSCEDPTRLNTQWLAATQFLAPGSMDIPLWTAICDRLEGEGGGDRPIIHAMRGVLAQAQQRQQRQGNTVSAAGQARQVPSTAAAAPMGAAAAAAAAEAAAAAAAAAAQAAATAAAEAMAAAGLPARAGAALQTQ